ncbi:MATE efflux family protein [Actinidia rufa]|uniref:Protein DETOXIFICATION n=1 Tax=Actinidia rufa TaxID=165716 RepID=A0A7J0ED59_9ERIC|nr:MATE efflux family protein [Actinidia rufa]
MQKHRPTFLSSFHKPGHVRRIDRQKPNTEPSPRAQHTNPPLSGDQRSQVHIQNSPPHDTNRALTLLSLHDLHGLPGPARRAGPGRRVPLRGLRQHHRLLGPIGPGPGHGTHLRPGLRGQKTHPLRLTVRKIWATMFTDDREIIALTSLALPIIGLCELGNCPQTTGCGVLRGTARPKVGANINLGCFYLVGMPVAVGLGFYAGLDFEGLWTGLLAAQSSCVVTMMVVLGRTDWEFQARRAKELTRGDRVDESEKIEGEEPHKDEKKGNSYCPFGGVCTRLVTLLVRPILVTPIITVALFLRPFILRFSLYSIADAYLDTATAMSVEHRVEPAQLLIPDDVLIERSGSNKDANLVDGEGNFEVRNLIKGTAVELWRLKKEAEGQSTSSSRSSSSDSFDLSNEDADEGVTGVVGDEKRTPRSKKGKKVNQIKDQVPAIPHLAQILVTEPILVLSSTSKAAGDLGFLEVSPAVEDLIKHSFNQGGSLEEEVDMVPKLRNLELQRAVANSDHMKKYSNDLKKANHKIPAFKGELKQARLDLAMAELIAIHARNEVEAALAKMNQVLQELVELKKVASKELGAPLDHPAWNALTPPLDDCHMLVYRWLGAIAEHDTTCPKRMLGFPSCHFTFLLNYLLLHLPS